MFSFLADMQHDSKNTPLTLASSLNISNLRAAERRELDHGFLLA